MFVFFASWEVDIDRPLLATAIHAGHELRPDVAARLAVDDATRRREEDSHSDDLARVVGSQVVVNRSRFEVDLNRDRADAVYMGPDDAWGIEIWQEPPPDDLLQRARTDHDLFYRRLGSVLGTLVRKHGGFVLYDVHSYNHRRSGPDRPPADPAANPLVNLGTGSLPDRWAPLAETFLATLGSATFAGQPIDVGENVNFRGRHLAAFVHRHFGDWGCALAIEFKKDFMDEWTGRVDRRLLEELCHALGTTVDPVWKAHQRCR